MSYTATMSGSENKDGKKMLETLERMYSELRSLKERHDREFSELNKEIVTLFKRISRSLPSQTIKAPDEILEDELYHEAYKVVTKAGIASTSYLQRMLGIGYARSAKLLDMLEENGVIGRPGQGHPREVLLSSQAQKILKDIEVQIKKKRSK